MFKKVVVTGSLAYDHIMSMPGHFRDHIMPDKLHILNISFIMNTFRQELGRTAGNIAWSLGLLGIPTVLIAAAGNDFDAYKKHLTRLKRVDISNIFEYKNKLTARGFVTTDSDDNQIWGFYEGAMRAGRKISVKPHLKKDTILMIAPNDPPAMIRYVEEAQTTKTPYVFDPAFNIPHFDAAFLKKAVKNAFILIGNDYEIELIGKRLGLTKSNLKKNTHILVTTYGSKGARIFSSGKTYIIPPAKPKDESDPTGAGDAFRAGFLAGLIRGYPLEICGKMGALVSVYTVERYGTQTHFFTRREFENRYRKNYHDKFRFDL